MIKQITEKSIGHRVLFHFFYSPERILYFKIIGEKPKILENYKDSLWNYLVEDIMQNKMSKGMYCIDIIEENKIFGIEYDERVVTEEEVIKFAHSLGL